MELLSNRYEFFCSPKAIYPHTINLLFRKLHIKISIWPAAIWFQQSVLSSWQRASERRRENEKQANGEREISLINLFIFFAPHIIFLATGKALPVAQIGFVPIRWFIFNVIFQFCIVMHFLSCLLYLLMIRIVFHSWHHSQHVCRTSYDIFFQPLFAKINTIHWYINDMK